MKIVKSHLKSTIINGIRDDNRKLYQYRDIKIDVNPIPKANGSARVKIGKTEVLVGIKMDVGEPFPDTPEEGVQIVGAELSPMASTNFESGPPREDAIELARVVDRGIRESKAIDTQKLCIIPGEKVWCVFIDIYPLNYEGNLFDAAALGAIVALKNARFPKYDKETDTVIHDEFTKEKFPLNHIPILTTFGKINNTTFVDPTENEEELLFARLSISTLENGNICAMQKGGNGTFTFKEINNLIKESNSLGKELRKLVK